MAITITLDTDSELLPLFGDQLRPGLHTLIALSRLQNDPTGMLAYAKEKKWTPGYKGQIKPHWVENGKVIKAEGDYREIGWKEYAVKFLSSEYQTDLRDACKAGHLKIIDSTTQRDAIAEWNKPMHRRPDLNSYTPKDRQVVRLSELNAWGQSLGYNFVTNMQPKIKASRTAQRDKAIRAQYAELERQGKRNYVKEIKKNVSGADKLSDRSIRRIAKAQGE